VIRPRFVVLEGGDGSGKSTQAQRLVTRLSELGVPAVSSFEPGATPAGARIRELLLHREEPIAPATEALLMAADRAQHVREVVRPAMQRGEWVVSDRYVPSSLVYQGVVRGIGVKAVETLNRFATDALEPDVVVVLDLAESEAVARHQGPSDRLEAEGAAFQAAVRDAYRELARVRGWSLVDGEGTLDQVGDRVWAVVAPLMGR
jgi:dTMP kinase